MYILYDARNNIKTEVTYRQLIDMSKMSATELIYCMDHEKPLGGLGYIINQNADKSKFKSLYAKEIFENEEWKTVADSEDEYLISNYGRVKKVCSSKPEGRFLLPHIKKGVNNPVIRIKKQGKLKEIYICKMVAEHFTEGYFEGCKVSHINGILHDNYYRNLTCYACE